MTPEMMLEQYQLELPPAPKAAGVYRPLVVWGPLVYLSGHLPLLPDGSLITGRLGAELDLQAGYRAARQVGLAVLSTLRAELGSLDRVWRIIKTVGFVNSTPAFVDQPGVVNGFSDLMAEIFGPAAGIGARSAVGAVSLPRNVAVEVEALFQLVLPAESASAGGEGREGKSDGVA